MSGGKYTSIRVVLSACLGVICFLLWLYVVISVSVQAKDLGNCCNSLCAPSVNACFTKYLEVAVWILCTDFHTSAQSVLLHLWYARKESLFLKKYCVSYFILIVCIRTSVWWWICSVVFITPIQVLDVYVMYFYLFVLKWLDVQKVCDCH